TEQALQQFVNQSPWDLTAVLQRYRHHLATAVAVPAGVIIVDDTSFPKKGTHSVGVARQYCGAVGTRENCQDSVSLHYTAPGGDDPLALRLYLPESWTSDPARLDKARVPAAARTFQPKWRIALNLLDQVQAAPLPHRAIVADAGYGVVPEFRR